MPFTPIIPWPVVLVRKPWLGFCLALILATILFAGFGNVMLSAPEGAHKINENRIRVCVERADLIVRAVFPDEDPRACLLERIVIASILASNIREKPQPAGRVFQSFVLVGCIGALLYFLFWRLCPEIELARATPKEG